MSWRRSRESSEDAHTPGLYTLVRGNQTRHETAERMKGHEWPWDSGMHWGDNIFVFIPLIPAGRWAGAARVAPHRGERCKG